MQGKGDCMDFAVSFLAVLKTLGAGRGSDTIDVTCDIKGGIPSQTRIEKNMLDGIRETSERVSWIWHELKSKGRRRGRDEGLRLRVKLAFEQPEPEREGFDAMLPTQIIIDPYAAFTLIDPVTKGVIYLQLSKIGDKRRDFDVDSWVREGPAPYPVLPGEKYTRREIYDPAMWFDHEKDTLEFRLHSPGRFGLTRANLVNAGIPNIKLTCHFASLMQSLAAMPGFFELHKERTRPVIESIKKAQTDPIPKKTQSVINIMEKLGTFFDGTASTKQMLSSLGSDTRALYPKETFSMNSFTEVHADLDYLFLFLLEENVFRHPIYEILPLAKNLCYPGPWKLIDSITFTYTTKIAINIPEAAQNPGIEIYPSGISQYSTSITPSTGTERKFFDVKDNDRLPSIIMSSIPNSRYTIMINTVDELKLKFPIKENLMFKCINVVEMRREIMKIMRKSGLESDLREYLTGLLPLTNEFAAHLKRGDKTDKEKFNGIKKKLEQNMEQYQIEKQNEIFKRHSNTESGAFEEIKTIQNSFVNDEIKWKFKRNFSLVAVIWGDGIHFFATVKDLATSTWHKFDDGVHTQLDEGQAKYLEDALKIGTLDKFVWTFVFYYCTDDLAPLNAETRP